MQNVYFEDYEGLANDIVKNLESIRKIDGYNDVAIVAKYEEARQIIKELVCIGYDLRSINLHDEMWENYDAEYVISITNINGENEIWCEPMLREKGYLTDDSPVIYVLDNCSSKVIPYCKGNVVFEVTVGGDEECEEFDYDFCASCKPCECNKENDKGITIEKDGDMHGFSVNRSGENGWSSYSFYSTNLNLVNEVAKLFR